MLSCRMKTRCLELEVSNEEYQKRYEQLDEDRADITAYLKRMLQEKEDEITELTERLEGTQKVHDKFRAGNLEDHENVFLKMKFFKNKSW